MIKDIAAIPGTDKCLVDAVSIISGKSSTMVIHTTTEKIHAWIIGNRPIQHALPELTKEEREFLISGITPEEWKSRVANEEEY